MTTPHRAHPAERSRRAVAVASTAAFLGLGITLACTTESGTTGTSDDGLVVTVESTGGSEQQSAPDASDESTATSDDWTAPSPAGGASAGPSHGSSGGS